MTYREMIRKPVLALLLGGWAATQMAAQANDREGGGHRGPPPQAYEACGGLSTGDSCVMTGRRGESLQGSCIVPREDEQALVCAPERGRERRRPPGEDS